MTRAVTCLLLLAGLLAPAAARAQQSEKPEFVGIRVGFDNHYKVGQWTPVDVTLRGGMASMTGVVTLMVDDGDGTPTRVGAEAAPGNICQVTPATLATVRMYVKFGPRDELIATFHEPVQVRGKTVAGKAIVQKKFDTEMQSDETHFLPAMEATQELIVTVGAASVGVQEAIDLAKVPQTEQQQDWQSGAQSGETETIAVRVGNVDQLPTRWYGYEGVDVLVLATSAAEIYRRLTPDGARIHALEQWVRMGGKLLLLVGSQADEVLAKDAPLARFAPGRLGEVVTLRSTAALEAYAGGSAPVPGAGGSTLTLRVPRLTDVRGTVEAKEADLPLIVRAPFGLGQVIFVAVDLGQPPFTRWADRGRLLGKLLDRSPAKTSQVEESAAVMHYGYNDMAGKLRSQLDEFTGVKMVPFWVVAGLILLYIVLIGPGDYFFLRKVVGRMQWTWVTFPAIVVVVSLGAYGLAYWLKGDQLRTNQVDLVDVDTAEGYVRGTTWMSFFSPRSDTYDLSFQPMLPDGKAAAEADVITSWLGFPGEGLGGIRPQASNPRLWSRGYDFSAGLGGMQGVPVQVWSTKSITARWHAPCSVYPRADLVQEDELPRGTITNTLDFPLENCLLAYGRWGYDLGRLEAGASVKIEPMSRQRVELRTLLTGNMTLDVSELSPSQGRRRYGGSSDGSIPETLRTMMFFDARGSSRQEGLCNRYQNFVDLSGLLKTDRAILVATVSGSTADKQQHPGAVALRDGQPMARAGDRHTIMYRFVFPVKKSE